MPVTLSATPPTDGQLRVINISWNMANKEPNQEDIHTILDTYPAGTVADIIVVSCQEETRIRKNGLASKLMNSIGFTGSLGNHNRKTHDTFTGGSPGQISLTVLSNLTPAPTVQFDEYWDPKMKKGFGPASFLNKGGITANITVPHCTPVNIANFHLESKKDDRRAVELMELWKRVHHINGVDKTYADLAKIAGPTFLMGDGNWRNIAVSHRLASHTTGSPYTNDTYNPARILALCGGTGPTHGISTYSGGNNIAVATPLTDQVDNERVVGKTNARYMKTGTLDFVSEIGNAACENKVITTITTPKIDHAPVLARSTSVSSDLSEFERTQKFVVDTIAGLAVVLPPDLKSDYEAQLSDLRMLSDTQENKEALSQAFNFYTRALNNYAMPAEIARMEGNTIKQSILQKETVTYVKQGVALLNDLINSISELSEIPPIETLSAEQMDALDTADDLPPIEELPAELAALLNTDDAIEGADISSLPDIEKTQAYFSDDDEAEAASPVSTVAARQDELNETTGHVFENSSFQALPAETEEFTAPRTVQAGVFCSSGFFQTPEQHRQKKLRAEETHSNTAAAEDENALPLEAKQ